MMTEPRTETGRFLAWLLAELTDENYPALIAKIEFESADIMRAQPNSGQTPTLTANPLTKVALAELGRVHDVYTDGQSPAVLTLARLDELFSRVYVVRVDPTTDSHLGQRIDGLAMADLNALIDYARERAAREACEDELRRYPKTPFGGPSVQPSEEGWLACVYTRRGGGTSRFHSGTGPTPTQAYLALLEALRND